LNKKLTTLVYDYKSWPFIRSNLTKMFVLTRSDVHLD
jgi:hypothetical protein